MRNVLGLLGAGVIVCGLAAAAPEETPAPPLDDGSATAYAELPHWPVGVFLPKLDSTKLSGNERPNASVLAWIPPDAKQIRALFLIPNNSDSKHIGEHPPVREAAIEHEMAIVYLRRSGGEDKVQEVLDELAQRTGIKEFRHAPWIVQGKSSTGMFPIHLMWRYPKRTIAGLTYHGQTPIWPVPVGEGAKLDGETILHLNANGESEWGGTWFVHVRPSLLNYRQYKGWLPNIAVVYGIGHGNYPEMDGGTPIPGKTLRVDVWDYIAVYMDKALELRLPEKGYPTEGPLVLRQVDDSKGYCIDPFAVETLFRQPNYPLAEKDGEYLIGSDGEPPTQGFAAISPAKEFDPPESVPVVPLQVGLSPSDWLVTKPLNFAMKQDPKKNLHGFDILRPKPGDTLTLDGQETVFSVLAANRRREKGGISLGGMKQWGESLSILGYTVLKVDAPATLQLEAPFSVAGRLHIIVNGVPVEHKQIVAFDKGLYPMMAVLSLDGPNWGAIDPKFQAADDTLIAHGKEFAQELARRAAAQARMEAEGYKNASPTIYAAASLSPEKRKQMFWVADLEQAKAWFKLHAVHGQPFAVVE